MKHLHEIAKYTTFLVGMGTSLYLFVNGRQNDAGEIFGATVFIFWFFF